LYGRFTSNWARHDSAVAPSSLTFGSKPMTNINDIILASEWLIDETGYGFDSCHDDMLESVSLEIGASTGINILKLKISAGSHTN